MIALWKSDSTRKTQVMLNSKIKQQFEMAYNMHRVDITIISMFQLEIFQCCIHRIVFNHLVIDQNEKLNDEHKIKTIPSEQIHRVYVSNNISNFNWAMLFRSRINVCSMNIVHAWRTIQLLSSAQMFCDRLFCDKKKSGHAAAHSQQIKCVADNQTQHWHSKIQANAIKTVKHYRLLSARQCSKNNNNCL